MIVELAIGDAYGAGFEYAPADIVRRHNNLKGYIKHRKHDIPVGAYTDDTQMSIAVVEAQLSGENWSQQLLAEKFVAAFKRDPRLGYAGGFYHFLVDVRDKKDFLAKIRPYSDKSGGAMRATTLGFEPKVAELLKKSRIQAEVTHHTESGIKAAQAASLLAHYFIYDKGPKAKVGQFIEDIIPPRNDKLNFLRWDSPYTGRVGEKGWMSVRAAITAIKETSSLSNLLMHCVDIGGDVDTVAAIALGAASNSKEIEQDLPKNLYEGLEDGPFGRSYLEELDLKLRDFYMGQFI